MSAKDDREQILLELASLERTSGLPTSADEARRKLNAQALDDAQIAARIAAFTTHADIDKTALLANYELLHGVGYLDRAARADSDLPCAAGAVLAVFRGAEICLHNLAVLASRMTASIDSHKLGEASVMERWCEHFHGTLYKFSQLVLEMDRGGEEGDFLNIGHSGAFRDYRAHVSRLHELLSGRAAESERDIGTKDLDDPRRYIGFNEFVNCNYEMMWFSILSAVRIPGVRKRDDEDDAQFFRRIVSCDDLREAVESVDLTSQSCLMQFRAYHQISETLVKYVGECGRKAIVALLSRDELELTRAACLLSTCNKTLGIVNDNITPIVRTLSPSAYSRIRPALGITSGSHSMNLRKALFNTIYPLLVRAFRLMICDFSSEDSADDVVVHDRAMQIVRGAGDSVRADLMRRLVYFHQHVRVWRDEHFQFIKTQIGVSAEDSAPTASISGSNDAAQTAHKFRGAHRSDPIAPLYRAVLGKSPPPVLDVLRVGEFDDYMARLTARAVKEMYADVQERVQKRRGNKARH
jgi:tryptophan 2,3-dioxygenase